MNMSDDVTGVTLQVVQKGADVAAHTAKELIDLIMRMLAEMNRQRERSNNKQPKVSSTDLTSIKPGQVGMDTLRSNAKTIGDTLSMSENALTKADMQFIAQKAKRYGIPVAFSNAKSKDNIFATVRTGDLPLFKQLCTELMKSKIAERPQELGNFRCDAWEIPFLTTHFNKNDLSAQFIQTADGKNLCIFVKKTNKAAKLFVTLSAIAITIAACTIVASAAGTAETAYQNTINFFITWIRRIGWFIAFIGAVMFALAIKHEDAEQKQKGLITMVAGFVVAALCMASSMFNLFE